MSLGKMMRTPFAPGSVVACLGFQRLIPKWDVIPAKAGIQSADGLDSRPGLLSAGVTFFRGNDLLDALRHLCGDET
jgi:hypothetical protein